jgi:deoxycytidine triphosphate deaminase
MFINPKQAISKGWLRNVDEKFIQPNAIDIPVTELYEVNSETVFELYSNKKQHRKRTKVKLQNNGPPTGVPIPDMWTIANKVYDWTSEVYVEVPEGYVGWLHTRSTLNRNGLLVHSGLYDSGFKGHVCGMLYNNGGEAKLQPGACFAQFIIASSDSEGTYSGGYNVEEGSKPWFDQSIIQR